MPIPKHIGPINILFGSNNDTSSNHKIFFNKCSSLKKFHLLSVETKTILPIRVANSSTMYFLIHDCFFLELSMRDACVVFVYAQSMSELA